VLGTLDSFRLLTFVERF